MKFYALCNSHAPPIHNFLLSFRIYQCNHADWMYPQLLLILAFECREPFQDARTALRDLARGESNISNNWRHRKESVVWRGGEGTQCDTGCIASFKKIRCSRFICFNPIHFHFKFGVRLIVSGRLRGIWGGCGSQSAAAPRGSEAFRGGQGKNSKDM